MTDTIIERSVWRNKRNGYLVIVLQAGSDYIKRRRLGGGVSRVRTTHVRRNTFLREYTREATND